MTYVSISKVYEHVTKTNWEASADKEQDIAYLFNQKYYFTFNADYVIFENVC